MICRGVTWYKLSHNLNNGFTNYGYAWKVFGASVACVGARVVAGVCVATNIDDIFSYVDNIYEHFFSNVLSNIRP